jgi:DNA transformation protein
MLTEAGIDSVDRLRELGAVEAFHQVRIRGVKASLNLLYAMEGAIQGQHWTRVRREIGPDLVFAVESLAERDGAGGDEPR